MPALLTTTSTGPDVFGDLRETRYAFVVIGHVPFVHMNTCLRLELSRRLFVGVVRRRDLISSSFQRLRNSRTNAASAAGNHCNSGHVSSSSLFMSRGIL